MQKILSQTIEIKSLTQAEGAFSGYASIFNKLDAHNDIILPGAFAETIKKNSDIKLLWQHQCDEPIGVITKLEETLHGLYVEGSILIEINRGKEAYELLKSQIVNGLSIGFEVIDCFYNNDVRYIKAVKLWEVSIVTFPANENAKIKDVKMLNSYLRVREKLNKVVNELQAILGK
jgi:HK97 family phage prohead protease